MEVRSLVCGLFKSRKRSRDAAGSSPTSPAHIQPDQQLLGTRKLLPNSSDRYFLTSFGVFVRASVEEEEEEEDAEDPHRWTLEPGAPATAAQHLD